MQWLRSNGYVDVLLSMNALSRLLTAGIFHKADRNHELEQSAVSSEILPIENLYRHRNVRQSFLKERTGSTRYVLHGIYSFVDGTIK